MSFPLFAKKPEVERKEFREALRKRLRGGAPPPKLSFQDKMKIEKKIFGPKYIEKISQDDYRKTINKMDRLKLRATTETDRKSIEGRVRYLKRVGGIKSLINPSQVKEIKKDTSAFQGKPYLRRPEIREWLRKGEIWKITRMPAKDRPGLEKKLFDLKRFGSFIDTKEAKIVRKDFENFPTRVKKRYGVKSRSERLKTLNLLKKFLGK